MFHAELISLSRGQSYDQIDILESRHGDFETYGLPQPFGARTIGFFYKGEVILAHPWGVRLIHLDRKPRSGATNGFTFDRIILDGDISYQNGTYIDDANYSSLGIPDIFEDPGEVIDQVTFSTDQGIFITHDANVVSIISKYARASRGVTKAHIPVIMQPQTLEAPLTHTKIRHK
jgi:hypothetical protein